MRHELTKQIEDLLTKQPKPFALNHQLDELITSWLQKKEEELCEEVVEWCEHIVKGENGGWYFKVRESFFNDMSMNEYRLVDDWENCICGKPRPAQKTQRLWEILRDADNALPKSGGVYSRLADTAKSWFINLVKAQPTSYEGSQGAFELSSKSFKEAILKSLDKNNG